MKKALFVITLFLLTALLTLTASATGSLLSDGANLLSADEEASLLTLLEECSSDASANIAVVTVYFYDGYDIERYAEDFCDDGFMYNGIVLLISKSTREYCITKCGPVEYAIDDAGLDFIEDAFLPYLSDGDYYVAFSIFAKLSRGALVEYNSSGTVYAGDDFRPNIQISSDGKVIITEGSRPLYHYVICLVIGLAIALVVMLVMQRGMKTVRSLDFAGGYIVNGSLEIRVSTDRFLYRTVSKTPKPKSNNSHGGFHGGGSGRSSSGRF